MAGKFFDLQKHATKIIKFKQAKVAQNEEAFWANMQASLDNGQFGYGFGSCFGISLLFIKDLLSRPDNLIDLGEKWSRFERDAAVSSNNPNSVAIFAESVTAQSGYIAAKGGGSDQLTAMSMAITKIGLKKSSSAAPSIGTGAFADELTKVMKNIQQKNAIIIGYYFTKPDGSGGTTSGGHAIAMGRYMGQILFFDPNVGGYTMPESVLKDFLSEYKVILKTQGTWDLKDAFDYLSIEK